MKKLVGRDTSHEPGASQTRSSDDSKSFIVEDETNHDSPLSAVTQVTSQVTSNNAERGEH